MKDYEQLYFDALYKIKNLEKENKIIKQELEMYKIFSTKKELKQIITDDLIKYLKNKENKRGNIK